MNHRSGVVIAAAALFSAACGASNPIAPSALGGVDTAASVSASGSAVAGTLASQVNCTIEIGETVRPLPAVHILAAWITASASSSSLTCGQIRSLGAKVQQLVPALDQPTQNFQQACGLSRAILGDIQALIATGQLAELTFPEPVPDAPTTVLGLAELMNENFCAAADAD